LGFDGRTGPSDAGVVVSLTATFVSYKSAFFFGRHGIDELLVAVLADGSCVGGFSNSWLLRQTLCCTGSLERKSLLNTFLNSVHLNFDIMLLNSKEKGGPFRILMRDETFVSVKNELRKDA
jgi:hypothetical protein